MTFNRNRNIGITHTPTHTYKVINLKDKKREVKNGSIRLKKKENMYGESVRTK